MICICRWCDRPFTVLEQNGSYQMDCAGHSVCLECSDLWEMEEIKLHQGKIRGVLDKLRNTVNTASGYPLPVNLFDWKEPHWPWQLSFHARAVDLYGRDWRVSMNKDNLVTLTPIGNI